MLFNLKTKKAVLVLAAVFAAAPAVFADKALEYISPNNDGIQDNLDVKFQISKKAGYLKSWAFVIFDAKGNVVRTIQNKVVFDFDEGSMSAKKFAKALMTSKHDVEVPSEIIWNGYLDDGSLAPDGEYYYQFNAVKTNGQASASAKVKFIVDNTAPDIDVVKLQGDDKNFGEGDKAILVIRQTGSKEKLWTAKITDSDGKVIRTYKWNDAAPNEITWNGTDDSNAIVKDGIYHYEITSTDLAGNTSEKAGIANIFFSAEKPQTSIAISGARYFAPEPKGEVAESRKDIKFDVSIPSPKASVNKLVDWKIQVVSKDGDGVLYSMEGKDKAPASFVFDGKGSKGSYLADGEYRTKVTARYLNGYEPEPVYSPVFVIDNEAPNVTVVLPESIFNGQKLFAIAQQTVAEESYTGPKTWSGKIVAADGTVAREYEFGNSLPSKVEWNGLNKDGQFADGAYKYVLEVTEPAGNKRTITSDNFTLDTSTTVLAVSVSPEAFSPNGDGVNDRMTITPVAKASSGINRYEVTVSLKGKAVKTFSGTGSVPAQISWDGLSDSGTRVADGRYSVAIKTVANSGTEDTSLPVEFIVDTTAPQVAVSAPYTLFSPDGISSKQTVPVKVDSCSDEELWTAEIRNVKNAIVKSYTWSGKAKDFAWDGTDDNGNKAADGAYSLKIASTDRAGNSGSASIQNIVVDTRPVSAFLTADFAGISPNGDRVLDAQKFNIKVSLNEGISSWKFDIVDSASGKAVKSFTEKDQADLPAAITWAGETAAGKTAEGTFSARLHIEYAKGNVADSVSGSFICTSKAPELAVKTTPEYFSPDNDGVDDEEIIQLSCKTLANLKNWTFTIFNPIKDENAPLKPFWKIGGKNVMTEKIIWDGRGNNGELVQSAEDYPYELVAYDDLGMSSKVTGVVKVDVLIIRDGDKLKMMIPSIIFRANHADFGLVKTDAKGNVIEKGITPAQAANNKRILKRVSEILNKFASYKVTVVGHSNYVMANDAEAIPLSRDRAEFVMNEIIKNGVKAERLSADGKGDTEPVADYKNSDVNWKNRRVEFILQK